jgi:hypothetical protein
MQTGRSYGTAGGLIVRESLGAHVVLLKIPGKGTLGEGGEKVVCRINSNPKPCVSTILRSDDVGIAVL